MKTTKLIEDGSKCLEILNHQQNTGLQDDFHNSFNIF